MKSLLVLLSIILFSFWGCMGGDRGSVTRNNQNITTTERDESVEIPVFNADSAYYYMEKQVAFGPRVPNSEAHVACGDWLQGKLIEFSDTVYVQTARVRAFDGSVLSIRNLIGSFQPENRNRILLCAHWDTRPWADHDPDPENHYTTFDGANDGASGVGVLLEIARLLSQSDTRIGVDIIFFDAEDYGKHRLSNIQDQDSWALGSQYWSRNPHRSDYFANYGILLDMVGAYNASFKHEGYSMMYAPNYVRKVWDIARSQGFDNYFLNTEGGFIIDDHYYVNTIRKIPVINIIDQRTDTPHGFFAYWHTMGDTMDAIDPLTLQAVGQTVTAVIYQE